MAILPISPLLPELERLLSQRPAVVLEAPPGAGKTTAVPLALYRSEWLHGQRIVMLEPRRLAARAAANYMAHLLGEKVGQTVGYRVRFDSQVSAQTRIEVVTEGVLTRRLQQDPELSGVGLVIFDEFHERNLHSDLALALCRDAQQGLREDLRLLVMSATLDGERIAALLQAPRIRSDGRSFPVDIRYRATPSEQRMEHATANAVREALAEESGDVLVFLPGAGEIKRCAQLLGDRQDVVLAPLYGDLPQAQQQAAIEPDPAGRRKVVLATAIAETSLTIEGIRVVIDSGWQRRSRFDANTGLGRLETVRVSQASATQRAGRAGRLQAGVCYRLWGDGIQRGLLPFNAPEIQEADLAPLALELAQWGIHDPAQLVWLDPPPATAYARARQLLNELDALDDSGRILPMGREMLRWPLHPRLAHMLVRTQELAAVDPHSLNELPALACDLAALLSERDPMRRQESLYDPDMRLRLDALHALRRDGQEGARRVGADPRACQAIERIASQWRRQLQLAPCRPEIAHEYAGLLLALAYPDRIARCRDGANGRYLLANGRGARLPSLHLAQTPWLVAAALDGAGSEARIWLAAPLSESLLREHFAGHIRCADEVVWDRQAQAVVAAERCGIGSVVLSQRVLDNPDPGAIQAAMLEGIREMGLASLPWNDNARQLQARVASLRQWLGEQGEEWPRLDDSWLVAHLEEWLAPYLPGIRRREHLQRLELFAILQARLDWPLQQDLERLAPTHLLVPSGSRKRLQYTGDGSAPVLAVKLQELFGLQETPCVAGGRVALSLHLLSPAQRPIQLTQDLAGFWQNTYAEVKKELKGRYPKHPWPDDPLQAKPTAGTKRRSGI